MVAFIERDDDPEIPPPYNFPGVTILSFRLQADLAKLQYLCDRWLNVGTLAKRGFEYIAFLPFVDMEIVTYPKMFFAQGRYVNWGYASQQELYFRFFVWKFLSVGGFMLPVPEPEIFFPFMFVDNSWSMIAGRDVTGFPKVEMQLNRPASTAANQFPISASALAMESYAPTTRLDWKPIMTVETVAAGSPLAAHHGTWPWIGLDYRSVDPFLQHLLQAVLASIPVTFSTVQLKQFRDVPGTIDACYQALVRTVFKPTNVGVPTVLPPATVTVNHYASLDIPDALGFALGVPLHPLLCYSIGLDMSLTGATNLFVNH